MQLQDVQGLYVRAHITWPCVMLSLIDTSSKSSIFKTLNTNTIMTSEVDETFQRLHSCLH